MNESSEDEVEISSPTSIVIFGITGDLAKRKLLPALWNLYKHNHLPRKFAIVGFARSNWTDEYTRSYVKNILREGGYAVDSEADDIHFFSKISYVIGDFSFEDAYPLLRERLKAIDDSIGMCGDKAFHLAVPPEYYAAIFDNLHSSGLADLCSGTGGWTRILVEKPFGNDVDSAVRLDEKLGKLFHEEQIFRVDHYMGKEVMQNIITFRFANALLENLWNSEFIESVNISLFEKVGIEGRGAFYDKIGAIRDVGQNHMLQMLACIAMEDPGILTPNNIRRSRAAVLEALRPLPIDQLGQYIRRMQYDGYRNEKNVAPDSTTETAFKIKTFIDNERWKNVPFTLQSGKRVRENNTTIEIVFKGKPSCVVRDEGYCPHNKLTFNIQPNEGIAISFWSKKPGLSMELEEQTLSFHYAIDKALIPDAYERVIHSCILGDQSLFTSTDEVLAAWRFITPILENLPKVQLEQYTETTE